MLSIIAHHLVVHSGLLDGITTDVSDLRYTYLLLLGMWGKTGINCFVLITGWFMCVKDISLRKYLKLLFEIWFYNVVINLIFWLSCYSDLTINSILRGLWPFWTVSDNFVGCYLLFYLFIPFLNVLIKNLTLKQHFILVSLGIGIYCILGSIPLFKVSFNYISWFIVLYLLASFIRLYPKDIFTNTRFWGFATLLSVALAVISVLILEYSDFLAQYIEIGNINGCYYFVYDSNKIMPLVVSLSCFLWFRNLALPNCAFLNTIASSTFGILLIHDNNDIMRKWLWKDALDCVGQYDTPLLHLVLYTVICVLVVYSACVLMDQLRICLFERPFFRWYDKKVMLSL